MKKSVILTIGVVYIISIIVVGFLGQAMRSYNENISVESIQCVSENYTDYDPSSKQYKEGYVGYIKPGKYEEGLKVLLKCQITPANATQKKLEYISGDPSICTITPQEDGTAIATFHKGKTVTVTIKSTDNKGYSIKIKIVVTDISDIV